MKTLKEIFNVVRGSMHWGPSLEPFHDAVIAEIEEVKASVSALEQKLAAMFPPMPAEPKYITAETVVTPPAQAVVEALAGPVADDAASLVEAAPAAPEPDPAEPVQTPVSNLLGAQPEPVPAGPDASQGPDDPAAENQSAPAPEAPAAPDPAASSDPAPASTTDVPQPAAPDASAPPAA